MTTPSPRTWARHFQDDWQARAGDPRLPYWLRVAALAYGSHGNNGHARFKRSEVALVLGTVDKRTGEVRPYPNVRRAIADAVEYGWLEEGSFWGCLIVPAHSVKKGDWASRTPCPLAAKHKERRANRSLSERNGPHSSTPDERFEDRTAHSVSGSEREPLSSDLSPATHPDPQANRLHLVHDRSA